MFVRKNLNIPIFSTSPPQRNGKVRSGKVQEIGTKQVQKIGVGRVRENKKITLTSDEVDSLTKADKIRIEKSNIEQSDLKNDLDVKALENNFSKLAFVLGLVAVIYYVVN